MSQDVLYVVDSVQFASTDHEQQSNILYTLFDNETGAIFNILYVLLLHKYLLPTVIIIKKGI